LKQEKELYLNDDFLRKLDQAETFKKDVCHCLGVLYFDLLDDISVASLLERAQSCGRVDDNTEIIAK
jgi:adenylate kinase family enzyme